MVFGGGVGGSGGGYDGGYGGCGSAEGGDVAANQWRSGLRKIEEPKTMT